jgi:hypothetical protein
MNTEEMATKIVESVRSYGGLSFAELVDILGEEARGDRVLSLPNSPNVLFWSGVSVVFIDALNIVKDQLTPDPCSPILYMMDGCVPTLPLFKKRYFGTDKECWAPVQLVMRTEKHNKELAKYRKKQATKMF